MLMRFQKRYSLDIPSTDGESDDINYDAIKRMDSKNPFVKFAIYVKLKKLIESYVGQKIN